MYAAYRRCSRAAGSRSGRSKAQSGEIGGDTSQEFMAVAAVGEDAFVWCRACDYAANTEAARSEAGAPPATVAPVDAPPRPRCTLPTCPGSKASRSTSAQADRLLKSHRVRRRRRARARARPRRPRGQRVRARRRSAPATVRLVTDADFAAHPELPKGYIGPDFPGAKDVVADSSVARRTPGSPARTRSTTTCATRCSGATSRRRSGPRSRWSRPATRARTAASRCASTAASRSATCSSSGRSTPRRSARRYTDDERGPAPDGDGLLRHRRRAGSSPRWSRSTTTSTGSPGPPRSRRSTCTSS